MHADAPTGAALLRETERLIGHAGPDAVRVSGSTGLGGPIPVSELAVGAVAAQLLGAARLREGAGPADVPLTIDAAHVGLSFRSEGNVWLDGRPVGATFPPLSRFCRTADGWIRLHAHYRHHEAALLAVLGNDVEGAAARRRGEDLETAIIEAGGAAAAVRTAAQWSQHPQGRAVSAMPLLTLRRSADGPPRRAALQGLRVLDLTHVIAGPVATRTLASHGADVIRLDSPRLPELPGLFLDTCVGKRCALLDFAAPDDRRTVEELLSSADVVVQGYRPGALAAFGLDPPSLAERHPHLIVVSLSAWGAAGPWEGRRGFDSLVQAATGIAVLCGASDEPGVLPAQALDHGTGHLAAATVLGALARQREEGGGWHGDLSLAQTAHWLLGAARSPEVDDPALAVDLDAYLLDLPSAQGTARVVAPPGSPAWSTAAEVLEGVRPAWRPRS